MSPYISTRSARALVRHLGGKSLEVHHVPKVQRALDELQRSTRPDPVRRRERERREKRRLARREAQEACRPEVVQRARGRCENPACRQRFTAYNPPEFEHFFGRAKGESTVETCWLLCRSCHLQKHRKPEHGRWFRLFIRHATPYGYAAAIARADDRLHVITTTRRPLR